MATYDANLHIDAFEQMEASRKTVYTVIAVPEYSVMSSGDRLEFGSFGSITFLDDEAIFAEPEDAFSYCNVESPLPVFVRSDILASPAFYASIAEDCANGNLDPTFCETAAAGVMPLSLLPEWHGWFGESRYDLGLYWDFPFLLRMEYEAFVAGAASAFSLSARPWSYPPGPPCTDNTTGPSPLSAYSMGPSAVSMVLGSSSRHDNT